jgi:branched-chain amino acid transport system substrate-binding protein
MRMQGLLSRRITAAACAVALILCIAPAPSRGADAKPIVIGTSVSLSGIFADGGKSSLEGYQLWIKLQNAKGGLLGRPVELKYYDDQSEGATGVRLYERLINEDHVDLIIGPYGTGLTAPVVNVAEKYKMPMLCPETGDLGIFQRGLKYAFQALGPLPTYLFGALQIAKDHGYKKLALVAPNIAFGQAMINLVPPIARGFGQSIVFSDYYPANLSDFSSVVERVRASNPDAVLAMSFPNDSVGLLRGLKAANYAPKMFYEAVGAADVQFANNVGGDAQGVVSVTGFNDTFKENGAPAFLKAYRDAYHREPDYHVASNFAAMTLLAAAVTKNKSLDQEKLRDTLGTIVVPTVTGTYKVDARNGIQMGYTSFIFQWQNGKQVILYPGNVAQGKPKLPFPSWSGR